MNPSKAAPRAEPEWLVGSDTILARYRLLMASGFRCSYRTEHFDVRALAGPAALRWALGVIRVSHRRFRRALFVHPLGNEADWLP